MSDLTPETITDGAERWGHKSIDTVVFAKKPKEVNFTMKSAAVLEGVFEESSRGWSVDDQQFYVVGKELPPSSNVLQSVTTNDDGEFRIDRLPTGFEWRLGMRIAHTALEIETDPFHFDQPGIYRCRLVLSSDASTDNEARLKLQLKDVERQE